MQKNLFHIFPAYLGIFAKTISAHFNKHNIQRQTLNNLFEWLRRRQHFYEIHIEDSKKVTEKLSLTKHQILLHQTTHTQPTSCAKKKRIIRKEKQFTSPIFLRIEFEYNLLKELSSNGLWCVERIVAPTLYSVRILQSLYMPPSSRHHSYMLVLHSGKTFRIPYDLLRNMINCRAHNIPRSVFPTARYSNAVENPTIYAEKKICPIPHIGIFDAVVRNRKSVIRKSLFRKGLRVFFLPESVYMVIRGWSI